MINNSHVETLKSRLKIFHDYEDSHLESLLNQSYEDIKTRCGTFDMDTSHAGSELVYERVRYAYNDSLEFFNANFISNITYFALQNWSDDDEVQS